MKSGFDWFNLNIKVGWFAANGINNGDHAGFDDLALKII